MRCSKLSKAFFILVLVCFAFSVISVSAGAEFYEESDEWLLNTAGVYGGTFVYFDTYDWQEWTGGESQFVLWIPENYKDNFSSDDFALVNITSTSMSLRCYDLNGTLYTVRAPGYSYLQIRSQNTPYSYHDCTSMYIYDTNLHVSGQNSPFYNSNPDWNTDTFYICMAIGFGALAIILGGGIFAKSRN